MINISEKEIQAKWKSNEIEVSVVCITYNHIDYIEQCIDSLLMQKTSFPFEIIIHDDASTDGTTDIIKKYKKKYPNIVSPIYERENQYKKKTINKIIYNNIKGKYIATCEGDDYWNHSDKLQVQYNFLEKNIDYSAVGHMTKVIDKFGRNSNLKLTVKPGDVNIEDINNFNVCAHTSSLFCRKEVYDLINSNSLFEDINSPGDKKKLLFIVKLGKLHVLPFYYSSYRYQSSSYSYSSGTNINENIYMYNILEELTKLAGNLDLDIDYKNIKYERICDMFVDYIKNGNKSFFKVFTDRKDKIDIIMFMIKYLFKKTKNHLIRKLNG